MGNFIIIMFHMRDFEIARRVLQPF